MLVMSYYKIDCELFWMTDVSTMWLDKCLYLMMNGLTSIKNYWDDRMTLNKIVLKENDWNL